MYLLIKYTKSVLWRVAKRLSYIEDARCLKVKELFKNISVAPYWYLRVHYSTPLHSLQCKLRHVSHRGTSFWMHSSQKFAAKPCTACPLSCGHSSDSGRPQQGFC